MAKTNKNADKVNEEVENIDVEETGLPETEELADDGVEELEDDSNELADDGFSIDDDLDTSEISTGGRKKAGIHENMELTSIEYKKRKPEDKGNWSEAVDFTFEDERQEKAIKREFFDPKKTTKEKQKNMLARVKHIMKKFLPEEECIVKGKNFEDLISNVKAKLEGKTEGVKLAVKCVNENGYGAIPNYMPFVVRQEDQTSNQALKISDKEITGNKPTNIEDLDASTENMEIPMD